MPTARSRIDELSLQILEMSTLKKNLEAKTAKNNALQDKLDNLQNDFVTLENKHRECKTEVQNLQRENKRLRKKHENEKEKHKDIADMLGRKIETESGSQVRILKEQIASELKVDYQDARRVANSTMTFSPDKLPPIWTFPVILAVFPTFKLPPTFTKLFASNCPRIWTLPLPLNAPEHFTSLSAYILPDTKKLPLVFTLE